MHLGSSETRRVLVARKTVYLMVKGLALVVYFAPLGPAISQPISSKRWIQIGATNTFGNWLDTATIVVEGKIRSAWTELRFYSPQVGNPEAYDREAYRTAYDCAKGETSIVETVEYLGDSIVSLRSEKTKEWLAPAPSSVGESELGYVCGKRALPKPILGGPSPLRSSAWTGIGRYGDSASKFSMSINATKLPRKGPIAQAWFLELYEHWQADSTGTAHNETEVLQAFDCVRRQVQIRRIVWYLDGSHVDGWDFPTAEWHEVVPETVAETMLRHACGGP